jgi:putative transcription factor
VAILVCHFNLCSTSIKKRKEITFLGGRRLRCEVCGRKIYGAAHRVIIEGAKMTVCSKCAKLGSGTWTPKPKPAQRKPLPSKSIKSSYPNVKLQKTPPSQILEPQMELIEDFGPKIRGAREKLGLSHEDLGRKINEKVSVLKKIEAGKMTPDTKLIIKLEHALKIKLVAPLAEPSPIQAYKKTAVPKLTLGDLIKLKEEMGDEKKREPS